MMETEWRPESLSVAQEIARHAEARATTAGRFAVAWVLNNRLVTAAIAGPRTEEQWEDYVAALSYRFTAEDEALVDRWSHPATPPRRATTTPPTRSRDACRSAALRAALGGGPDVAVTRGEAGAEAATAAGTLRAPAFPVAAIDTTGAGDCWCGVLAAALDAGAPLERAMLRAAAAAAIACTRPGAAAAMPGAAETDALLASPA